MKNKLFILFFSIILIFTCILCAIHENSPTKSKAVTTEPIQTTVQPTTSSPTVSIYTKEPIVLEQNSTKIITLTDDEEKNLSYWTSSDESIVTVDSGGRIDAVKIGTATVTAYFGDHEKHEREITVTEAKKETVDTHTTAITANQDILNANKNNSNGINLYKICVNRKQNCVTVYTYDSNNKYTVPVRAMICSCGKQNGNETITGNYVMYGKYKWLGLLNNVQGHYVSGISGDYLFHSVPYDNQSADTLEAEEFNKLGVYASLGCVRLASSDTKWIYENCPNGTEISIFDSDEAGPLGKPESIKITDLNCGWDPTDDNKDNPYNSLKPKIYGAEDIKINAGDDFSPISGVTALDTCSNIVTDKISITENVITSRVGTYKVTYSVTDALHRTAEKTITVTVKAKGLS